MNAKLFDKKLNLLVYIMLVPVLKIKLRPSMTHYYFRGNPFLTDPSEDKHFTERNKTNTDRQSYYLFYICIIISCIEKTLCLL